MLEPYRELLRRLREEPESWREAAYAPVPDPKWTRVDSSYTRRFGVLVCVQYDWCPEDHALVRYLLEQEVAARRDDPFQGDPPALHLGVYLLTRYRYAADVPLLWAAKMANFDTLCGVDARYVLAADWEAALELFATFPPEIQASLGEMLGKAPEALRAEELDEWWRGKQREFPEREEDEHPQVLAQRAITLGALEEGRRWADRWEEAEPADARMLLSLMYLREELEQPEKALEAAERLRELSRGNDWEYGGALRRLPKYLVRLQRHEEAWDVLRELDRLLRRHRDWMKAGLSMMIMEETFDLAADEGCPNAIRRAAWEQGHGLIRRGVRTSLVTLRKAATVAGLVGARAQEKRYAAQAAQEHERIYGKQEQP